MRRAVLLSLTVSLCAQAASETVPPKQTLVFYNARLALKDGRSTDVLKLWLLRNSLADTGPNGLYDEEFRSVVWAALGNLGLCQDAYSKDDSRGAGLWPLALHNWIIHNLNRGPVSSPSPFGSFDVGVQQRLISLHDTLSDEELRTVSFYATDCLRVTTTMFDLEDTLSVDLTDRLVVARVLRRMLVHALKTLTRQKVQSVAAVEARIFDLDLAMVNLLARKKRQDGAAAEQKARALGISKAGATAVRDTVATWADNSSQAAFLRRTLTWTASEWLTLNRQRRLFLFSQARAFTKDPARIEPLQLALIDELIARKDGAELELWIASLDLAATPAKRAPLTEGDRGKRLLELEPETGFHERATISLHRGLAYLEAGQLQEALRSFAFSMAHADESREGAVILPLARRWLSYVLARYETSDEVIAVLKALVPRQEYNSVIEDLVWRAALRADAASFDRIVASARHGGAFDARAARLKLLAHNQPGELVTQLRDSAAEEPYLTLRFSRQLIEKLEGEDADVRASNVPMLKLLITVLDSVAAKVGYKAQILAAEELVARGRAMLEGLQAFDTTPASQAKALGLRHEAFAGNIRLAPADALPWPFTAAQPEPPSPFVPLVLQPVEWRDDKGALVFGWKLTE